MKITVKEVRVLKTGTNDYGEWKLIKVTTEDEEYTTLAKEANLIPSGATINITDMDEDERGKKFKKFEIITGAIEEASKEGEAKPQRGERNSSTNASIEAQVAFKGMIELISTGMVKTGTDEYKATIRWAMGRICLPTVIIEKIEEAKGETTKTDEDNQETQSEPTDRQDSGEAIKTAGELFSWIMSKDKSIKVPRVWLEADYEVTHEEVLTVEKIQKLHKQITKNKGW